MQKFLSLLKASALVSGLIYSTGALADWSVAGAQYICNTDAGEFVLLPHDETSDGTDPLETGYTKLPEGESNIVCKIGKRKLNAQINVYPPASRGMCGGTGLVAIDSLTIDSVELLKQRINLDWSCWGSEPVIAKIVVKQKDNKTHLEQTQHIYAKGDYSKFESKVVSDTFDIDTIAAQNAKIDNNQDNIQYQQEHLATKLPPENDLAKVFPAKFPESSDVPLCAHWDALFINAITDPDKQRHGRIAGKTGERTYIHKANSQICQLPEDDGCNPKAYLIPGDRVDIGFICGNWTYIQYESRVRNKPHIKGWVETNHLYDVDPVKLVPERPSVANKNKSNEDSLLIAIRENNLDEVNKLITSGVDPNGSDHNGLPLVIAIDSQNLKILKALLKTGAKVDLLERYCTGATADALDNNDIFDVILKSGFNLDCRDTINSSQTPLMNEARNSLFLWWQYRYEPIVSRIDIPWRDPAVRIRKLITAGADVNALDSSGRSALFYVTQSNNVDAAKALLTSGADPNIATDMKEGSGSDGQQDGSTALMSAFHWYTLTYDPTLFRMLLGMVQIQTIATNHVITPNGMQQLKALLLLLDKLY